MIFGSVCSGIEAASVAWHPLGWKAAWLAEIEPFPSAVLAHHYPDVPNLGDMTRLPRMVLTGEIAAPDGLVGGTPCQAFSVAGLREGLSDERGQLTIKYVELADAIDFVRGRSGLPAAILVWENVPGVLSSRDNAFGCFLGALAGEDQELEPEPCPAAGRSSRYWRWDKKSGQHTPSWPNAGAVVGPARTIAWRVLDAQYFGLAQRRRRVFVVASARKGFDPAAVLFEFDGVRRDSAPSREAGEDLAAGTLRSTDGGSDVDHARANHLVECFGGGRTSGSVEVAACLTAKGQRIDFEVETFAVHGAQDPDVRVDLAHTLGRNNGMENAVFAIQAGALRTNPNSGPDGVGVQEHISYTIEARAEVQAVCVTGGVTHTLKAEGFDASEDGTGRGQPIGAVVAGTLGANHGNVKAEHAWTGQLAHHGRSVRRLTPTECERLQGFPDGYTLIPVGKRNRHGVLTRTKPAADGPRYKALGNSMAVACMAWIGRRIQRQLDMAEQQRTAA